jgi:hypothetical protein
VTAEIARELAAVIPDAEMMTVPGLWADDPIGVTDRVLSWVLDNR